jgi:signal transduction histidine kinase
MRTSLRAFAAIGLLAAAAAAWNLHAPTVFFDSQLMLGGSLAVFALLEFGWVGLAVGAAASAATFFRWGHPWNMVVGTAFYVWLGVFLERFNGSRSNGVNGRILPAAVAFWLLMGFWLEVAFFRLVFGLGGVDAVVLGLKEAVTGLCNASLGFLLFMALHVWRCRRKPEARSVRGLTSAIVLAAVVLPSLLLVLILSKQLKDVTLEARVAEMRSFGVQMALSGSMAAPGSSRSEHAGLAVAVRGPDGLRDCSDPALFARIARDHAEIPPDSTGLGLYEPAARPAKLTANRDTYAFTTFALPAGAADDAPLTVTVVEPVQAVLDLLDFGLILPSFASILGFLVLGAIGGSLLGAVVERDRQRADAARERERHADERMRQELDRKLRTSLQAAAVAHEINQPLSRLLLRARLALESEAGADRTMLAALVADAKRVVVTIQKMKVLLRNVETVQHEVDLAAITTSSLHQVKPLLRDAGVTVTRGGQERGCLLLGDDVQLQMIIINLLTNAIEAIVAGQGLRRDIVVEHHVRDDVVELVVGDSGPGWPGGTVDDMLLNTTKPGGAGIGLYVVKTAVDNHRGTITIGRSPLGGAEFRVTFPGCGQPRLARFFMAPQRRDSRPATR